MCRPFSNCIDNAVFFEIFFPSIDNATIRFIGIRFERFVNSNDRLLFNPWHYCVAYRKPPITAHLDAASSLRNVFDARSFTLTLAGSSIILVVPQCEASAIQTD